MTKKVKGHEKILKKESIFFGNLWKKMFGRPRRAAPPPPTKIYRRTPPTPWRRCTALHHCLHEAILRFSLILLYRFDTCRSSLLAKFPRTNMSVGLSLGLFLAIYSHRLYNSGIYHSLGVRLEMENFMKCCRVKISLKHFNETFIESFINFIGLLSKN